MLRPWTNNDLTVLFLLAQEFSYNGKCAARRNSKEENIMDRDQNAGTGGDQGSPSYQERGDDRTDDLTRRDEASMDRTAQAGFSGAFDAATNPDATRESMRHDAADAFGGTVSDTGGGAGGATGGGAAAQPASPAPGSGVSLGDVPAGSGAAAGAEADKDLAGPSAGGAGNDSMGAGNVGT